MNFLAHLYLAEPTAHGLVGSLMGDFVKGPLGGRYPDTLLRALERHRRVDSFTDSHPVVAASRSRVRGPRRRFAGIMVDMFFDHFLARDWPQWSDEPLERFTARVYVALQAHREVLPERLQRIAPRMAESDWLASYRDVQSVHVALDRMGERLKRGNALLGAGAELDDQYREFGADFRAFFPDLVRFAHGL